MDRTLNKFAIGQELLTVNTSYEGLFLAYDKYAITNIAIKAALQSLIVNKADVAMDEGLSEDFKVSYEIIGEGNDQIVEVFMVTKNPVYRVLLNSDIKDTEVSKVDTFKCDRKLTPTIKNELTGILKTVKYTKVGFYKTLMFLCDNNIGLYMAPKTDAIVS